jgi:formate C-acetyltransferase
VLDQREKISFKVSPERRRYRDTIIPFGRESDAVLFNQMTGEWWRTRRVSSPSSWEQRAPGIPCWMTRFIESMLDFNQKSMPVGGLDYHDPSAYESRNCVPRSRGALISYARRRAEPANWRTDDSGRKSELLQIAEVCEHVPAHAPRNLWEALQYYWFVHLGVTIELNTWDAFSPGHLDQHLLPFYQQGLDDGELTSEAAMELLQCFGSNSTTSPLRPRLA